MITTHRVLFSTKQVVPIAGDHPASTMAMRRRPEGRTGESYYSVTLATSAGTDVELPLMNQPNAEWFQHFLYDRSERLFVHREGSDGGIDRFVVILFMLYFVLMGTLTVLRAMRWAELSIDETRRMVTVRRHPWFKTHVEEVTLATLGLARVVEVRGAKTSYSLVIDRVDQTVLQVMDLSNQNYLKGIAERINEHLSGGHRAVSR